MPVPVSSATAEPTKTPAYASIPGVYLGTFHGTSSFSADLFEQIGKGVAISAGYLGWGNPFSTGTYNTYARLGRIGLVTWEYNPSKTGPMADYTDGTLQAILDGVHDEYMKRFAAGVRDFGKPVLIRWGHEMNGDWYPWSGVKNGGGQLDGFGDPGKPDGPERFIAAYRYIHQLFQSEGAQNALWVWCPNAPFEAVENAYGAGGWNAAANYYPGDDVVDWLCFDGYNWGTSAYGQRFNSRWASFDEIFGESYRQLQVINSDKPILIGEFASTEDGGDKAAWIRAAFDSIQNRYPQIRGLVWFHINKETDWRINSTPESLAAFSQAVAGDDWLDEWPGLKGP